MAKGLTKMVARQYTKNKIQSIIIDKVDKTTGERLERVILLKDALINLMENLERVEADGTIFVPGKKGPLQGA
jgi:hypothetical protein